MPIEDITVSLVRGENEVCACAARFVSISDVSLLAEQTALGMNEIPSGEIIVLVISRDEETLIETSFLSIGPDPFPPPLTTPVSSDSCPFGTSE